MALILLAATILLADLAIKAVVEEADPGDFPRKLEATKGFIIIHRSHNAGFPMGVLRDKPELVKVIPLSVLSGVAGVFLWLYPKKGHVLEKTGASLVLAGGLSNLWDRWKRGYVVDYFSFRVKKLEKIVFNIGDMAVFLGAAVMFIAQVIEVVRER